MSNVPLPERKMAPVQGWPQGIPWSLHLEAYAAYCKKWSPQPALIDLEGRNCRGGFGTDELDEFIPGWRERTSEIAQLRNELAHASAVSAAKDAEIAGLRAELLKSLADNVALRAEVAGLREDAERYRHMRNNSQFQSRNGPGLYWYLPRYGQGDEGEQLDAAIDAARKGTTPTTPPPSLSPRS